MKVRRGVVPTQMSLRKFFLKLFVRLKFEIKSNELKEAFVNLKSKFSDGVSAIFLSKQALKSSAVSRVDGVLTVTEVTKLAVQTAIERQSAVSKVDGIQSLDYKFSHISQTATEEKGSNRKNSEIILDRCSVLTCSMVFFCMANAIKGGGRVPTQNRVVVPNPKAVDRKRSIAEMVLTADLGSFRALSTEDLQAPFALEDRNL
ncbi:hypothetical protein TNCV_1848691 [Trichonephila clavipes]|nr:hypothetical protein TNCV_1848691 [Trichonephila clavipes]